MIHADQLGRTEFTDALTIRLISTAYIDEPALTPLIDDANELAFLEGFEGLTSPRRQTGMPLPAGVEPDELLTERDGYGWTYVNVAFCYTRTSGNRFNTAERGAWYACFGETAAETAQAEVCWHLTRELEATGVFENVTAYRELIAGFVCEFHDLRPAPEDPALDPDPVIGYPAGQKLARDLLGLGSAGLVYPSVRRAGGFCLAAFRPHLVQHVRQGQTWTFEWAGNPTPRISPAEG